MSDYEITALILSEHEVFRREFARLDDLPPEELEAAWASLADSLEVHASGEEDMFYPLLAQAGREEADDARSQVHDHNEIRDSVRAVAEQEVGSEGWWTAVRNAQEVNAEHMAEEERESLPSFREAVDAEQRGELGMRWLEFHDQHEGARGLSGEDEDPDALVETARQAAAGVASVPNGSA